ncbi:MAG: dTMP kinase [Rikenellaceae bacterium]
MFIVIEGLDGAGKSTQVARLTKWIESKGKKVEYLHFPRFSAPVYGELIARFLRGELGKIDEVNPYLVALIYAGDRAEAAAMVRRWQEEGSVVLVDRYVLSNIAYQCAKLGEGKAELKEWILDLEYTRNNIPQPDVTIFLDVPFKFTAEKLTAQRSGEDRDYLKGKEDIHEASLTFQESVREVYLEHTAESYYIVECADMTTGEMLPIEDISERIIEKIAPLF